MAKDIYHDQVKQALIKEGWHITHDPLFIQFGGVDLYVDLGAEKVIGAEKDGRKIAVEIKSFAQPSVISEFHSALGQYLNYRVALQEKHPERVLYLAVPEDAYKNFFRLLFTQTVMQAYQLSLVIFDPAKEVIVQWIEPNNTSNL